MPSLLEVKTNNAWRPGGGIAAEYSRRSSDRDEDDEDEEQGNGSNS